MTAIELTPEDIRTIRNVIYREQVIATRIAQGVVTLSYQERYAKEADALQKMIEVFQPYVGNDDTVTITIDVAKPEVSFKDMMLTHLYGTYPRYYRVIEKYVTAVEYVDAGRGPEVQWEYFINEDGTLHTDLVDEDFTYYRDNMYPDQVYSCH